MHSEAQRRKLTKLIVRDLKESIKHPRVEWLRKAAIVVGRVHNRYVYMRVTRNSRGLWTVSHLDPYIDETTHLWEGHQLKEAGPYIQTLMLLTKR